MEQEKGLWPFWDQFEHNYVTLKNVEAKKKINKSDVLFSWIGKKSF
jgi:hypothetical protein